MNDPPNHQGTPAANTASPARWPPAVPLRCTVPDPAPWDHRGSTREAPGKGVKGPKHLGKHEGSDGFEMNLMNSFGMEKMAKMENLMA